MSHPDTTGKCIDFISKEMMIDSQIVKKVIDRYIELAIKCLEAEMPFAMTKFCRFYHKYTHPPLRPQGSYYTDKIYKLVEVKMHDNIHSRTSGWVHDLGLKDNRRVQVLKMKIKPSEIEKIRRKKVLDDQRTLGFRSDLIFETPPDSDKALEKTFEESPSVEDIMKRIGFNLKK